MAAKLCVFCLASAAIATPAAKDTRLVSELLTAGSEVRVEELLLAQDDECPGSNNQQACALNALQYRMSKGEGDPKEDDDSVASSQEGDTKGHEDSDVRYVKLPVGWTADNDFPAETPANEAGTKNEVTDQQNEDSDEVMESGNSCQQHRNAHRCYLYSVCHGPRYCVVGGYMIVPGFPAAGMEAINGGNAHSFDYLMRAAHSKCGSSRCVLITNPSGHRTQDQLHIHYRYYNGGGAALKRRLEHSLCGSSGWKGFNECGHAKARIFSGFPGVFSAVAGVFGGGSLANIGITVWSTTACGGYKTMVLATTGCSLEHSVTGR